jgi:hypothetical protein
LHLRRIAQVASLVALSCLTVSVVIGGARGALVGPLVASPADFVGQIVIYTLRGLGGTLAIAAPTLLLVAFGQAHQWVRFRIFLSVAVALTLVGSLTILYYLLPAYVPSLWWAYRGLYSGPEAPNIKVILFTIQVLLSMGPSALLALSTLAFSAVRVSQQQVSPPMSSPESDLELHVEPIAQKQPEW